MIVTYFSDTLTGGIRAPTLPAVTPMCLPWPDVWMVWRGCLRESLAFSNSQCLCYVLMVRPYDDRDRIPAGCRISQNVDGFRALFAQSPRSGERIRDDFG